MAEEVKNDLVFLRKSLTNLPSILIRCVQNEIITRDDKENIIAGETSFDKNERFIDTLMQRDWKDIKVSIIKILRETSNKHCADKLEGVGTPPQKSLELTSSEKKIREIWSEERQTNRIISSKWWPEEKHLPLAFLERKEEGKKLVNILKEYLQKSKNKSTVINQGAAVSGMGGVGKTTIAKWFAIRFQDLYDHIIWIDSGEENLLTCFSELAKELKVDTTLRLNLLSKICFSKLEKAKCLFIFDNAECYQGHQGIRDFLPKHDNFHTIITSRTKEWGSESGDGKIQEMHLNAFPKQGSVEFLMKNLKDKLNTEGQLEELSGLLGNLPLALQIAVTTINTKKLSLADYIERIKQTEHIINKNFDDYEKTINRTMKTTLDIIKYHEEDPGQTAHKILLILGYVRPDLVDVKLFQSIEHLSESETEVALELLEKYSLITNQYFEGNMKAMKPLKIIKSCCIHRLLQQVIRHNRKEDAKVTLTNILNVEGFLNYKLRPYLYADEETRCLFPKIRAQLVDQWKLNDVIEQRKFVEAVEISRLIKDTMKTPMAEYNFAVCLEKVDDLVEAESILKVLHINLLCKIDEPVSFDRQYQRGKDIIDSCINENGLWNLDEQLKPELVRGLLFLVYNRLGMEVEANEVIKQDFQLITFTTPLCLDYVMKFLKSQTNPNSDYRLENGEKFLFLKLENTYIKKYKENTKKISLEGCSLSEDFPNDLDHLSLVNVNILNGKRHPRKYSYLRTSITHNLKTVRIGCNASTKLAIMINGNLQICHSISLFNCIIELQNGQRITPMEIYLEGISFMRIGEKFEKVCLNDLIDFQQTKKLTLKGSNMSIKLEESLSINEIFLGNFSSLDLNDFNCTVNFLNIEHTCVSLLDKNIALRVNKLRLFRCSVHLTSLFFLSQYANEAILHIVVIEIDEISMQRQMGIRAPNVDLGGVKVNQDSVEVTEILLNKILDLKIIKRLKVWNKSNIAITFDLNQQFCFDYLELERVKLLNWDKSTSSVETLVLWNVEIRDILISQFRVAETLDIWDSVVDVISLDNISASTNEVILRDTSLHLDANPNNPSLKPHHITGQVKEIKLLGINMFMEGKEIENFLVDEFINISEINSLTLVPEDYEESSYTLDMGKVIFSLNNISLENVEVLNWGKGKGYVNEMRLIGISFMKKNDIKINSLEFEGSSIDLSCLPQNIQRIQLEEESAVNCKEQIIFNDLNRVILHGTPSELKYFSFCPNLVKVELKYVRGDEFLLNLQWIPKSIKAIKLIREHRFSSSLTITGLESCLFKLETLIFDNFLLQQTEAALAALKPEHVIFYKSMSSANANTDIVSKSFKVYKSIAIGPFKWESNEHFQNYPLSKFVDERGEFYIFEKNQKGRVIGKTEFVKAMTF